MVISVTVSLRRGLLEFGYFLSLLAGNGFFLNVVLEGMVSYITFRLRRGHGLKRLV